MIGGLEFVCAQAPYSMKGIIFISVYMCLGLSLALVELMFLPFRSTVISVGGVVVGCVFWFLLASAVCVLWCSVLFWELQVTATRTEREMSTTVSLMIL